MNRLWICTSRSSYPPEMSLKALRLTLDHFERLQAIEMAEIIVAASGDTKETEEAVAGVQVSYGLSCRRVPLL